ncbi:uncharacterized protein LOC130717652 isoform X2 [Lotus japonicus]|nr:uncharacterized protein LOC130717652 isoform X2 [Lotus japonicus]
MVLALLQSVAGGSSTTEKPVDDAFVEPIAVICTKSEVSSTDTPSRNPTSDSVIIVSDHETCEENDTGPSYNKEKKATTARGAPNSPNGQNENLMNYSQNICAQAKIGSATKFEIKENKSYIISGQVDQRPAGNLLLQADEPQQSPSLRNHCNGGMNAGVTNQIVGFEDGLYTNVVHVTECERSGISLSKKLKSTMENDLQTSNCEAISASASRIMVSKSNEDKKSQVNEMMVLRNKNIPVMHSRCDSTIHMASIDGNKLSSDEDSNVRLLEENCSHCASCHRTELVLSGRKRCKQEVMIGSKKVKKQIQETSCCYVNRESSFMNLVSNMMKGYSLSTQDEDKSLALAVDCSDRHLPWNDQELITCYKNQDPEVRNNLKSIYCPSFENVATRMSHQVGDASKDFEQGKRVHGIDATPINCCAENNCLYRLSMQSNKFEVSKGRNEAGPSLHSSSTRQNKNNDENVESLELYDRKEFCPKSDTLGDLWITRFSPKLTAPLMIVDQLNEKCGSEVLSDYCSMIPHFHKQISHLNNCKVEETGEQSADEQLFSETRRLQNCFINKEASTVLVDDKLNIDHTSKHKFNPIKSFPRLRDSEPMVSMFAKRLGAIRQCEQTE